jgi:hypothetical protein
VPEQELRDKAKVIADYLGLPLEIRETGFNYLETRLVELMNKPAAKNP